MTKYTPRDVQHWLSLLSKSRMVEPVAIRLNIPPSSFKTTIRKHTGRAAGEFLQGAAMAGKSVSDFDPGPSHDDAKTIPAAPPLDPVAQYTERKDVSRLRRENAQVIEELHDSRARNALLDGMVDNARAPRVAAREHGGMREAMPVILASDWHFEETVDPVSVAGRNEYNLEIAEQRAQRFFQGVQWLIQHHRSSFAIRDALLWLGGDLITGYIHEELKETNGLSPTEAVLAVQSVLRDGIASLLANCQLERLIVPCSYGNHGRTTFKSQIKTGAINSFEWLMYRQLQREFAHDPRVEFVIDKSAHQYVDAYDWSLHFHHGDNVKFNGGVGGLSIPLNKRIPMWDLVRPAHLHHIGHYHQWLDLGRALVNGSLIGYSDFAMSIGAGYERPQQGFYLLDSKRGKCMVTSIWVDGEPNA